MRPNNQSQTDIDDIRHQGQCHNQGLLEGQGYTEQRDQKDVNVNLKYLLVRGPDLDLFQCQGRITEKGQGHIDQEYYY